MVFLNGVECPVMWLAMRRGNHLKLGRKIQYKQSSAAARFLGLISGVISPLIQPQQDSPHCSGGLPILWIGSMRASLLGAAGGEDIDFNKTLIV